MANSILKNINYKVGKLCRLGSRKAKLMAISNRRKQQLRHLGERVYIFKALQQDEDIWEKDEISQLLLTIADLDQEQEMVIDEINEIKAESSPEDLCSDYQDETASPATEAPVEAAAPKVIIETPEVKKEAEKAEVKKAEAKKAEVKKETKKPTATVARPAKTEKKTTAKPKAPPRRTASKKATPAKSDTDKQ